MEIREEMDAENRHRFDRQRERGQERLNQEMATLGARRLQLQALPINNPNPVPQRTWARAYKRANARGLTANELGERRQRQEGRQVAEYTRITQANEEYERIATQDLLDSQRSTITIAPRRQRSPKSISPTTPPRQSQNLPIRTPTTVERPRPRQTSPSLSPMASPSAMEPPASTAPPNLGRGKRKMAPTRKYAQAKATGEIGGWSQKDEAEP